MSIVIRVLGGFIGLLLAWASIFTIYVFGFSSPITIGGAIGLMGFSLIFLWYAFTGKSTKSMGQKLWD